MFRLPAIWLETKGSPDPSLDDLYSNNALWQCNENIVWFLSTSACCRGGSKEGGIADEIKSWYQLSKGEAELLCRCGGRRVSKYGPMDHNISAWILQINLSSDKKLGECRCSWTDSSKNFIFPRRWIFYASITACFLYFGFGNDIIIFMATKMPRKVFPEIPLSILLLLFMKRTFNAEILKGFFWFKICHNYGLSFCEIASNNLHL